MRHIHRIGAIDRELNIDSQRLFNLGETAMTAGKDFEYWREEKLLYRLILVVMLEEQILKET